VLKVSFARPQAAISLASCRTIKSPLHRYLGQYLLTTPSIKHLNIFQLNRLNSYKEQE
jgi:hypothetical protein